MNHNTQYYFHSSTTLPSEQRKDELQPWQSGKQTHGLSPKPLNPTLKTVPYLKFLLSCASVRENSSPPAAPSTRFEKIQFWPCSGILLLRCNGRIHLWQVNGLNNAREPRASRALSVIMPSRSSIYIIKIGFWIIILFRLANETV